MEVEVEFKIASPLERRHSRVLRDRRDRGAVDLDSERAVATSFQEGAAHCALVMMMPSCWYYRACSVERNVLHWGEESSARFVAWKRRRSKNQN